MSFRGRSSTSPLTLRLTPLAQTSWWMADTALPSHNLEIE